MALPIQLAGDMSAAQISFNKQYNDAYKGAQPISSAFATTFSSSTKTQKYPLLAKTARLRRWDGERVSQSARVYTYSLSDEKFEATLAIPMEDFEDDNLGIYAPFVADMGQQAAHWPDDQVFAAVLAGATELAYDGAAFFADSHSLNGNTIDNLFASTALTVDNVHAVIEAMMSYVGEDARTLGVMPDTIMVPPALRRQALEIAGAGLISNVFGTNTAASATDNVLAGTLKVIVAPQLAAAAGGSDTSWYMMDTSRAVKPFIFQRRVAPQFRQLTPTSEHAFMTDEVKYGVRARGVAGYGPFWLAALCTA